MPARARAQLHVSVILSVVAATSLRAFEVLLAAMFPGMPRYAIVRQLVRFASGASRARPAPSLRAACGPARAGSRRPLGGMRGPADTARTRLDLPVSGSRTPAAQPSVHSVLSPTRPRAAGRLRGLRAALAEAPEAAAALQAPRSLLRSLSPAKRAEGSESPRSPGFRSPAAPSPWRAAVQGASLGEPGPAPPAGQGSREPGSPGRTPARPRGFEAVQSAPLPPPGGAAAGAASLADGGGGGSGGGGGGIEGAGAEARTPAPGAQQPAGPAGEPSPAPQAPEPGQAPGPRTPAPAGQAGGSPVGSTVRDLLAEWRAASTAAAGENPGTGAPGGPGGGSGVGVEAQGLDAFLPMSSVPEPGRYGGAGAGAAGVRILSSFSSGSLKSPSGSLNGGCSLKSAIAPGGSASVSEALGRRLKKRVSFSEDNEVALYTE